MAINVAEQLLAALSLADHDRNEPSGHQPHPEAVRHGGVGQHKVARHQRPHDAAKVAREEPGAAADENAPHADEESENAQVDKGRQNGHWVPDGPQVARQPREHTAGHQAQDHVERLPAFHQAQLAEGVGLEHGQRHQHGHQQAHQHPQHHGDAGHGVLDAHKEGRYLNACQLGHLLADQLELRGDESYHGQQQYDPHDCDDRSAQLRALPLASPLHTHAFLLPCQT
ncbi:MAG: hypothetical protein BWY79_02086 [Actinobacteria bacterium ADurb.Bin444]|nr:MAG: hypothetical protein BWY79_02086 [Actinobacteria bacterium ADurb.Bin444]